MQEESVLGPYRADLGKLLGVLHSRFIGFLIRNRQFKRIYSRKNLHLRGFIDSAESAEAFLSSCSAAICFYKGLDESKETIWVSRKCSIFVHSNRKNKLVDVEPCKTHD